MEPYLPLIIAFVGGAALKELIAWLRGKKGDKVHLTSAQDDQTARWRDDALKMSLLVLEANKDKNSVSNRLNDCTETIEQIAKCENCKHLLVGLVPTT